MFYELERPENLGESTLYHLGVDTEADRSGLPGLERFAPGTDVFVAQTSTAYMLGSDGVWRAI